VVPRVVKRKSRLESAYAIKCPQRIRTNFEWSVFSAEDLKYREELSALVALYGAFNPQGEIEWMVMAPPSPVASTPRGSFVSDTFPGTICEDHDSTPTDEFSVVGV